MGNAVSPCCHPSSKLSVKLVFWEGTTRIITGKKLAGEIMFQFPDKMICHANSFFIGHPIPSLGIDDELITGETYFVLPIDRFACNVLSAASLAALNSSPKRPSPINFGDSPFQYIKGSNGRLLIKVSPEFIARLVVKGSDPCCSSSPSNNSLLCTTPELQKHFSQLVVPKEQLWSPKLETISECNIKVSPRRLLGLEWRSQQPS